MTGAYTFKRFTPGDGQDHWETPRGHWCAFMGGIQGKPGRIRFVNICCPECGEVGMLPHRIDARGGVHPSIVCTGKRGTCKFHTIPNTLEGWDFEERPDTKNA